MNFHLICDSKDQFCGGEIWIRGHDELDVNAVVLDDNDSRWELACAHIQAGDYYIKEHEYEEEAQP